LELTASGLPTIDTTVTQIAAAPDFAGRTGLFDLKSSGSLSEVTTSGLQQVGTSGVVASDGSIWFLGAATVDSAGNCAVYRLSTARLTQMPCDGTNLTVNGTSIDLQIAPITLPNQTPGTRSSATITVPGSSGQFTYSLASGTLPPGLSLTSSGNLSGTATVGGTFNFTVMATCTSIAGLVCTQVCTLTVNNYVTSTAVSTNWSGYVIQPGSKVNHVSGTWVEPSYPIADTGSNSIWVGIDGWGGATVEQIGTAWNKQAGYSAWVEFYGDCKGYDANNQPIQPGPFYYQTNIPVAIQGGDTISATVFWIGDNNNGTSTFEFQLIDYPKSGGNNEIYHQDLTTTNIVAQRATGEWISEANQVGGVEQPLANFGTLSFTGARAGVDSSLGLGPIDAFQGPTAINMQPNPNGGGGTVTTSALNDSLGSSSFTLTWRGAGGAANVAAASTTSVNNGSLSLDANNSVGEGDELANVCSAIAGVQGREVNKVPVGERVSSWKRSGRHAVTSVSLAGTPFRSNHALAFALQRAMPAVDVGRTPLRDLAKQLLMGAPQ
jgi:hypothetical protein